MRPLLRTGEILELVPGMVVTLATVADPALTSDAINQVFGAS